MMLNLSYNPNPKTKPYPNLTPTSTLSKASDRLFSILYADDTSVFIQGDSIEQIKNSLNMELAKGTTWLTSTMLTINAENHITCFDHRAII